MARKPRNDGDNVELAQLPAAVQARPMLAGESVSMMAPASSARAERMERDVEDVMSEVGGSDVTVKVMRRGENGAMYACGTMAADTFTVEALTDAYGGGSYQLRFMRGRSEIERATVEVDPMIPPRNPRMPKPVPGAAPVVQSQSPDMMASVVAMMGTMMTSMMTSTQALVATMAEVSKSRPPERDVVGEFAKMAEVLRPASGGPATPVSEALSLLREGIKMGQGKDGDNDSVMPVIAEGVRAVGALAQAAVEERRTNAHAARQALQQTPAQTATATVAVPPAVAPASAPVADTPATDTTMTRVWHLAAAPYKGVLVAMVGKAQPGNAAAMILDVLDDDQLSDLAADIESDGPEVFAARSVSLFGLRDTDAGWLAELAAEVLAQSEADEPEPEAGAETPVTP
jgi:hypothetical protein